MTVFRERYEMIEPSKRDWEQKKCVRFYKEL